MRTAAALILGVFAMVLGIIICTELAQTPDGRLLLHYLNWFSFALGIGYMIQGARRGNFLRLGFGFLLVCSVLARPVFPEPLNSGIQLFFAVAGAFVRPPRSNI